MTFEEAEELLNSQEIEKVAVAMRQWHPSILAEMLKAVTFARYQRYLSSHPDWTAAVREVAEKAGFELTPIEGSGSPSDGRLRDCSVVVVRLPCRLQR